MNLISDEDPPSSSHSRPNRGAEPADSKYSGRILLVEDNPADVALIREALDEHGVQCDVVVKTDGERAIQFIDEVENGETFCPDLIVLDLNLPKRTGREVLEHLRSRGKCAQVPVLILSSSDAAKDRLETAKLGATRYIRKPSRLDEFLQLGSVFKEMLDRPLPH